VIGIAFLAALTASPAQCPLPALSVDNQDAAFVRAFAERSENHTRLRDSFASGYSSACAKGLLKDRPLPAIVLLNAPNANIASIYEDEGGRTLLEYPFVTEDGQTHVPPAEEIEEAIYCALVGATEAEQEESGRCLPD
jgi:hypothetical protein